MAIGSDSYGSTAAIAKLIPNYANAAGVFDASTRPSLLTVEGEVDRVSGIVNAGLAARGYTIPIASSSDAPLKLLLDAYVNDEVAKIVVGVNREGRFSPKGKAAGPTKSAVDMLEEVDKMIVLLNRRAAVSKGVTRQDAYSADLDHVESADVTSSEYS